MNTSTGHEGEATTPAAQTRRRPGGRTSRTRTKVLDAARDLLISQGSAGLTIETLSKASGVHRSTIYRRWIDVPGVVADLAAEIGRDLDLPDTGTLEGDLSAAAGRLANSLDEAGIALTRAVLGWPDPRIRASLDAFWEERQLVVGQILRRHGSGADARAVTRAVAGPLYYQGLMEGRTPTSSDVRSAVAAGLLVVEKPQDRHGNRAPACRRDR